MYASLITPTGKTLINLAKVNAVQLILNKITINYTSDKSEDLVIIYDDKTKASTSFRNFCQEVKYLDN